MPLFETAIPIDAAEVEKIVSENWNLKLGKLIKASQNHTFEAFSEDGQNKFSVRVTPDPDSKHLQRITDELFFVQYLVNAGINHLCSPQVPIKESPHKAFIVVGSLIIAVFQWAKGSPLGFVEFRWMKDTAVIKAWGRFFGQLHKLSKKFGKDHPEVVKRIQRWDQVHCSILSGVKLHPEDAALLEDPEHYGALHGDLNTSNIHYVDGENHLSVYDTDQVQVGFYLFDMAQACFTIVMLDEGGMPITGTPVEGVNPKAFFDAMIEGYESEGFKVDVERLKRMVDIKRQLYVRFAVQAFKEGNIPADMLPFLAYIRDSLVPKWKIEE